MHNTNLRFEPFGTVENGSDGVDDAESGDASHSSQSDWCLSLTTNSDDDKNTFSPHIHEEHMKPNNRHRHRRSTRTRTSRISTTDLAVDYEWLHDLSEEDDYPSRDRQIASQLQTGHSLTPFHTQVYSHRPPSKASSTHHDGGTSGLTLPSVSHTPSSLLIMVTLPLLFNKINDSSISLFADSLILFFESVNTILFASSDSRKKSEPFLENQVQKSRPSPTNSFFSAPLFSVSPFLKLQLSSSTIFSQLFENIISDKAITRHIPNSVAVPPFPSSFSISPIEDGVSDTEIFSTDSIILPIVDLPPSHTLLQRKVDNIKQMKTQSLTKFSSHVDDIALFFQKPFSSSIQQSRPLVYDQSNRMYYSSFGPFSTSVLAHQIFPPSLDTMTRHLLDAVKFSDGISQLYRQNELAIQPSDLDPLLAALSLFLSRIVLDGAHTDLIEMIIPVIIKLSFNLSSSVSDVALQSLVPYLLGDLVIPAEEHEHDLSRGTVLEILELEKEYKAWKDKVSGVEPPEKKVEKKQKSIFSLRRGLRSTGSPRTSPQSNSPQTTPAAPPQQAAQTTLPVSPQETTARRTSPSPSPRASPRLGSQSPSQSGNPVTSPQMNQATPPNLIRSISTRALNDQHDSGPMYYPFQHKLSWNGLHSTLHNILNLCNTEIAIRQTQLVNHSSTRLMHLLHASDHVTVSFALSFIESLTLSFLVVPTSLAPPPNHISVYPFDNPSVNSLSTSRHMQIRTPSLTNNYTATLFWSSAVVHLISFAFRKILDVPSKTQQLKQSGLSSFYPIQHITSSFFKTTHTSFPDETYCHAAHIANLILTSKLTQSQQISSDKNLTDIEEDYAKKPKEKKPKPPPDPKPTLTIESVHPILKYYLLQTLMNEEQAFHHINSRTSLSAPTPTSGEVALIPYIGGMIKQEPESEEKDVPSLFFSPNRDIADEYAALFLNVMTSVLDTEGTITFLMNILLERDDIVASEERWREVENRKESNYIELRRSLLVEVTPELFYKECLIPTEFQANPTQPTVASPYSYSRRPPLASVPSSSSPTLSPSPVPDPHLPSPTHPHTLHPRSLIIHALILLTNILAQSEINRVYLRDHIIDSIYIVARYGTLKPRYPFIEGCEGCDPQDYLNSLTPEQLAEREQERADNREIQRIIAQFFHTLFLAEDPVLSSPGLMNSWTTIFLHRHNPPNVRVPRIVPPHMNPQFHQQHLTDTAGIIHPSEYVAGSESHNSVILHGTLKGYVLLIRSHPPEKYPYLWQPVLSVFLKPAFSANLTIHDKALFTFVLQQMLKTIHPSTFGYFAPSGYLIGQKYLPLSLVLTDYAVESANTSLHLIYPLPTPVESERHHRFNALHPSFHPHHIPRPFERDNVSSSLHDHEMKKESTVSTQQIKESEEIISTMWKERLVDVIAQNTLATSLPLVSLSVDFIVCTLLSAYTRIPHSALPKYEEGGYKFVRVAHIIAIASKGFVYRSFMRLLRSTILMINSSIALKNQQQQQLEGQPIASAYRDALAFFSGDSDTLDLVPQTEIKAMSAPFSLETHKSESHLLVRTSVNTITFFSAMAIICEDLPHSKSDDLLPLLIDSLILPYPIKLHAILAISNLVRKDPANSDRARQLGLIPILLKLFFISVWNIVHIVFNRLRTVFSSLPDDMVWIENELRNKDSLLFVFVSNQPPSFDLRYAVTSMPWFVQATNPFIKAPPHNVPVASQLQIYSDIAAETLDLLSSLSKLNKLNSIVMLQPNRVPFKNQDGHTFECKVSVFDLMEFILHFFYPFAITSQHEDMARGLVAAIRNRRDEQSEMDMKIRMAIGRTIGGKPSRRQSQERTPIVQFPHSKHPFFLMTALRVLIRISIDHVKILLRQSTFRYILVPSLHSRIGSYARSCPVANIQSSALQFLVETEKYLITKWTFNELSMLTNTPSTEVQSQLSRSFSALDTVKAFLASKPSFRIVSFHRRFVPNTLGSIVSTELPIRPNLPSFTVATAILAPPFCPETEDSESTPKQVSSLLLPNPYRYTLSDLPDYLVPYAYCLSSASSPVLFNDPVYAHPLFSAPNPSSYLDCLILLSTLPSGAGQFADAFANFKQEKRSSSVLVIPPANQVEFSILLHWVWIHFSEYLRIIAEKGEKVTHPASDAQLDSMIEKCEFAEIDEDELKRQPIHRASLQKTKTVTIDHRTYSSNDLSAHSDQEKPGSPMKEVEEVVEKESDQPYFDYMTMASPSNPFSPNQYLFPLMECLHVVANVIHVQPSHVAYLASPLQNVPPIRLGRMTDTQLHPFGPGSAPSPFLSSLTPRTLTLPKSTALTSCNYPGLAGKVARSQAKPSIIQLLFALIDHPNVDMDLVLLAGRIIVRSLAVSPVLRSWILTSYDLVPMLSRISYYSNWTNYLKHGITFKYPPPHVESPPIYTTDPKSYQQSPPLPNIEQFVTAIFPHEKHHSQHSSSSHKERPTSEPVEYLYYSDQRIPKVLAIIFSGVVYSIVQGRILTTENHSSKSFQHRQHHSITHIRRRRETYLNIGDKQPEGPLNMKRNYLSSNLLISTDLTSDDNEQQRKLRRRLTSFSSTIGNERLLIHEMEASPAMYGVAHTPVRGTFSDKTIGSTRSTRPIPFISGLSTVRPPPPSVEQHAMNEPRMMLMLNTFASTRYKSLMHCCRVAFLNPLSVNITRGTSSLVIRSALENIASRVYVRSDESQSDFFTRPKSKVLENMQQTYQPLKSYIPSYHTEDLSFVVSMSLKTLEVLAVRNFLSQTIIVRDECVLLTIIACVASVDDASALSACNILSSIIQHDPFVGVRIVNSPLFMPALITLLSRVADPQDHPIASKQNTSTRCLSDACLLLFVNALLVAPSCVMKDVLSIAPSFPHMKVPKLATSNNPHSSSFVPHPSALLDDSHSIFSLLIASARSNDPVYPTRSLILVMKIIRLLLHMSPSPYASLRMSLSYSKMIAYHDNPSLFLETAFHDLKLFLSVLQHVDKPTIVSEASTTLTAVIITSQQLQSGWCTGAWDGDQTGEWEQIHAGQTAESITHSMNYEPPHTKPSPAPSPRHSPEPTEYILTKDVDRRGVIRNHRKIAGSLTSFIMLFGTHFGVGAPLPSELSKPPPGSNVLTNPGEIQQAQSKPIWYQKLDTLILDDPRFLWLSNPIDRTIPLVDYHVHPPYETRNDTQLQNEDHSQEEPKSPVPQVIFERKPIARPVLFELRKETHKPFLTTTLIMPAEEAKSAAEKSNAENCQKCGLPLGVSIIASRKLCIVEDDENAYPKGMLAKLEAEKEMQVKKAEENLRKVEDTKKIQTAVNKASKADSVADIETPNDVRARVKLEEEAQISLRYGLTSLRTRFKTMPLEVLRPLFSIVIGETLYYFAMPKTNSEEEMVQIDDYAHFAAFLLAWRTDQATLRKEIERPDMAALSSLTFIAEDTIRNEYSRTLLDLFSTAPDDKDHGIKQGGIKFLIEIFSNRDAPDNVKAMIIKILLTILVGHRSVCRGMRYTPDRQPGDDRFRNSPDSLIVPQEIPPQIVTEGIGYRSLTEVYREKIAKWATSNFLAMVRPQYNTADPNTPEHLKHHQSQTILTSDIIRSLAMTCLFQLIGRNYSLDGISENQFVPSLINILFSEQSSKKIPPPIPISSKPGDVQQWSTMPLIEASMYTNQTVECALWVLAQLTSSPTAGTLIATTVAHGGITAIVSALSRHYINQGFLSAGFCALSNILAGAVSYQRIFGVNCRGVELISTLLMQNIDLIALFHMLSCLVCLSSGMPELIPLFHCRNLPQRVLLLVRQLSACQVRNAKEFLPTESAHRSLSADYDHQPPQLFVPAKQLSNSLYYNQLCNTWIQDFVPTPVSGSLGDAQNKEWINRVATTADKQTQASSVKLSQDSEGPSGFSEFADGIVVVDSLDYHTVKIDSSFVSQESPMWEQQEAMWEDERRLKLINDMKYLRTVHTHNGAIVGSPQELSYQDVMVPLAEDDFEQRPLSPTDFHTHSLADVDFDEVGNFFEDLQLEKIKLLMTQQAKSNPTAAANLQHILIEKRDWNDEDVARIESEYLDVPTTNEKRLVNISVIPLPTAIILAASDYISNCLPSLLSSEHELVIDSSNVSTSPTKDSFSFVSSTKISDSCLSIPCQEETTTSYQATVSDTYYT